MRHGLQHHAPFPTPSSTPSSAPLNWISEASVAVAPTSASSITAARGPNMLLSVFLALFLPCAGMSAVFIVYICLLWYAANYNQPSDVPMPVKPGGDKGLSESQLEKLPKITGKGLVLGTECAVCLDEIESEQPARLLPVCNHGFHLTCADTWLSKNPVCPVCRSKLDSQLFSPVDPENPPLPPPSPPPS